MDLLLPMRAAKDELRNQMRRRRLALDPAVAAAQAEEAAERLLSALAERHLGRVALYASVRSEMSTLPLLRRLRGIGAEVYYPRIVAGTRQLDFHRMDGDLPLRANRVGIPEPPAEAPTVAPDRLDLIVVPGLAFDRTGHRLGWGRAYYDNTLVAYRSALRVGLAYDFQIVRKVPITPGDQPMDVLATETGARPTGARPLEPQWRVR